jgi:hypothetical protein
MTFGTRTTTATIDLRCLVWIGAYLVKLGAATMSSVRRDGARWFAHDAANSAVADFDAFIASGQLARDEGDDA